MTLGWLGLDSQFIYILGWAYPTIGGPTNIGWYYWLLYDGTSILDCLRINPAVEYITQPSSLSKVRTELSLPQNKVLSLSLSCHSPIFVPTPYLCHSLPIYTLLLWVGVSWWVKIPSISGAHYSGGMSGFFSLGHCSPTSNLALERWPTLYSWSDPLVTCAWGQTYTRQADSPKELSRLLNVYGFSAPPFSISGYMGRNGAEITMNRGPNNFRKWLTSLGTLHGT